MNAPNTLPRLPILALLVAFSLVGCSTQFSSLGKRDTAGNATIYEADEVEFLPAAFEAITRQFPSSRLQELRGYERGFAWSYMPLLDNTNYKFTITKVVGETAKGETVFGIAYSIRTSGTQGMVDSRYVAPLIEELDRVCTERGIAPLKVVTAKPEQVASAGKKAGGTSTGTGFFVSVDGYLITSQHVVDGAKAIAVMTPTGRKTALLIKSDAANDIALLKVDLITRPLPIGESQQVRKGDSVLTLGYPLTGLQGQEQKATFGRINALSGVRDDVRYLQIDVTIQPGNSGGPLLNDSGEVVGIVTGSLSELKTLRASGSLPQNVNYATKIDYAIPLFHGNTSPAKRGPSVGPPKRLSDVIQDAEPSVVMVFADR